MDGSNNPSFFHDGKEDKKIILPPLSRILQFPPIVPRQPQRPSPPYFVFTIPPLHNEESTEQPVPVRSSARNEEDSQPSKRVERRFSASSIVWRPWNPQSVPPSIGIKSLTLPVHSCGQEQDFKQKYGALFELTEQPQFKQRKAYKHTVRYLQPNPLQIAKRASRPNEVLPNITKGTVEVILASEDGEDLPAEFQQIMKTKNRSTFQAITVQDRAKFSLMFTESSNGKLFRLKFRIKFEAVDQGTLFAVEEEVLSQAFHVDCNQRRPKEYKNALSLDSASDRAIPKQSPASLNWSKVLELMDISN